MGRWSWRFAFVVVLWLALGSGAVGAAPGRGLGGRFPGGGRIGGERPGMRSFEGGFFHQPPHRFDRGPGGLALVYPYPLYGYDPYYPDYLYAPPCDPYSPYYNPDYCYGPYD